MNELAPTADMTISEAFGRWPETVLVYDRCRTACVRCAMAAFDTGTNDKDNEVACFAGLYSLPPSTARGPRPVPDMKRFGFTEVAMEVVSGLWIIATFAMGL